MTALRALSGAVDVVSGHRKVFYGWWLLAAAVVSMALGSGVSFWSFGLYVEPLEAEFGWSRAEVSLGFSVSLLVSGLAAPLIGRWIDTRGPRSAILVGAVLTALSYLLLAFTNTLWQWYLFSAINAVVRQLMFFMPFMALISRWFDRRRGIAVSILGSGFSLGGFIMVPLMSAAIGGLGWRGAFVVSGVATAALFLPVGWFIVRNSPADVGAEVDGAPAHDTNLPRPAVEGLTLREALRTPLFWTLAFAVTLLFFGMFGWLVHQIPFYESVGISRANAAWLVSVTAGLGIGTRLLVGALADRVPRFEVLTIVLVLFLISAMATLSISTAPAAIVLFLVFWVAGTAGGPIIEALLLTRAFGVAHFATILGAVVVVETLGQVISPTIAGAIFDRTGSYDAAILLFIGTYVASLALFVVALKLPRPDLTRGIAELPVSRPAPTPGAAVAEMRESERS
ncbi:MAG: MFS transporter [Chloroflexi bacterium]|nr:MFS transporter [Chloroflexota bacterium]MDA1148135.1 MFS transporter [Chloroflexota bacterium]